MRPTSERNVGWENENSSFHEGVSCTRNFVLEENRMAYVIWGECRMRC